jgi:hypothetical protein
MSVVNKELLSTFANFGTPTRLQRNIMFEHCNNLPGTYINEGGAGLLHETGKAYIWNTPIDLRYVGMTIFKILPIKKMNLKLIVFQHVVLLHLNLDHGSFLRILEVL